MSFSVRIETPTPVLRFSLLFAVKSPRTQGSFKHQLTPPQSQSPLFTSYKSPYGPK